MHFVEVMIIIIIIRRMGEEIKKEQVGGFRSITRQNQSKSNSMLSDKANALTFQLFIAYSYVERRQMSHNLPHLLFIFAF